jgi:hypothetical protein
MSNFAGSKIFLAGQRNSQELIFKQILGVFNFSVTEML